MKLIPKNWGDFQHYKDRSPPWIRLHKSLLDNYDFQCLPVASKALAPMLWLIASESSDLKTGSFDGAPKKLAFRLRMTEQEVIDALKPLIDSGFFEAYRDDSGLLADCLRDAVPETETETETETEITLVDGKPSTPVCPHQEIIDLYHEHCPTLASVKVWHETRRKHLQARWREDPKRQSLGYWERFFVYVAQSDFLTGNPGPWKADLEWLVNASNFVKVIEGKYHAEVAA